MDTGGGGGASSPTATMSRWKFAAWRQFQHLLDKSTPHVGRRWLGFAAVALLYALRVYLVQGFYVVSYGLGIYILNLLIGFLSPQVDPETVILDADVPTLPSTASDEFRPFVRRLPEFKFWFVPSSPYFQILIYNYFIGPRTTVIPMNHNHLGTLIRRHNEASCCVLFVVL